MKVFRQGLSSAAYERRDTRQRDMLNSVCGRFLLSLCRDQHIALASPMSVVASSFTGSMLSACAALFLSINTQASCGEKGIGRI